MKKILTFLMMFAMTAGILSAQIMVEDPVGPTLNYQLVVRDANNNLVVDSNVVAHVFIVSFPDGVEPNADGVSDNIYYQGSAGRTNHNGMLSIVIGTGEEQEGSLTEINWSNAWIGVEVYTPDLQTEIMMYDRPGDPVYAVPLAEQAYFALTTNQILDYLNRPSQDPSATYDFETTGDDVTQIWMALREKTDFHNAIRDSIVKYVKANYGIAKEIALYYIGQFGKDDARDIYSHIESINPSAKAAIQRCIEDYVRRHSDLPIELAKYYIRTATSDDVDTIVKMVKANETAYHYVDSVLTFYLDARMQALGMDTSCLTNNGFSSLCDLYAAAQMVVVDPTDVCPGIVSLMNTSDYGLYSLYLNNGIIMTAYVKNMGTNPDAGTYGILLSETPIDSYTRFEDIPATLIESSVHYTSLAQNGRFGKIVDTMSQTGNCGKTLYFRAYLLQIGNTECGGDKFILSDQMSYQVPIFEILEPQAGDTKLRFSPTEAGDVLGDQQYASHTKWYLGSTYVKDGIGFETLTPGQTYHVVVTVRGCIVEKDVTIPQNN